MSESIHRDFTIQTVISCVLICRRQCETTKRSRWLDCVICAIICSLKPRVSGMVGAPKANLASRQKCSENILQILNEKLMK